MFDWNDIRYLVAVADKGSTLAAARALRVSQTTVARRISALEAATGLTLVDRQQAGYRLTPDGESLLGSARAMTDAADHFGQLAASRSRATGGTVRLTTEDIYAQGLLAPMLAQLRESHPDIVIELDVTSDFRDLGAGEADVALRGTSHDSPAGIVGRRLGRNDWTLYCSRDYADRHGVPNSKQELRAHAIVGGGGGSLWRHYQAFLREQGLEDRIASHQATSGGLLASVRAGVGVGVLPCIIADAEPDLIRCLPPMQDERQAIWLLTHERVRHSPPVRATIDFLYDKLRDRVRATGLA